MQRNDSNPGRTPPIGVKRDSKDEADNAPFRSSHLYIQVSAFSSRDNAERLKARLTDEGLPALSTQDDAGRLHRVRLGPYDDLESANAVLAKLGELGNNGAQIIVDR